MLVTGSLGGAAGTVLSQFIPNSTNATFLGRAIARDTATGDIASFQVSGSLRVNGAGVVTISAGGSTFSTTPTGTLAAATLTPTVGAANRLDWIAAAGTATTSWSLESETVTV